MIYTDYTRIKDIIFTHPELMAPKSKDMIIQIYSEIKNLERVIDRKEEELNTYKAKKEELETQFNELEPFFTIVYDTIEKDEVHEDVNISFNMSADINKNVH